VASVVAPPGVTVATATNKRSGRIEVIGTRPGDRTSHCTDRGCIRKANNPDVIHYGA
jgi:hypothetical protein